MAKLFHDVDLVERTHITRDGKVEKIYQASAYTSSGVYFSIDIPEADFRKDKVTEILSAKAAEIESIKAL